MSEDINCDPFHFCYILFRLWRQNKIFKRFQFYFLPVFFSVKSINKTSSFSNYYCFHEAKKLSTLFCFLVFQQRQGAARKVFPWTADDHNADYIYLHGDGLVLRKTFGDTPLLISILAFYIDVCIMFLFVNIYKSTTSSFLFHPDISS